MKNNWEQILNRSRVSRGGPDGELIEQENRSRGWERRRVMRNDVFKSKPPFASFVSFAVRNQRPFNLLFNKKDGKLSLTAFGICF